MQLIQIGGPLLLLIILTACSSTSADELTKELQNVTSWAATANMVGDAWIHGNVPTAYTKETLSTAQKNLHKEKETLSHSSIDPMQRRMIVENLQRLESIVSQMSKAVEQKDYHAISQQIKQLSNQEKKLSTLAKAGGEEP